VRTEMAFCGRDAGANDKACANLPIAASPARGTGNRSRPRSARLGPGKSPSASYVAPARALIVSRGNAHADVTRRSWATTRRRRRGVSIPRSSEAPTTVVVKVVDIGASVRLQVEVFRHGRRRRIQTCGLERRIGSLGSTELLPSARTHRRPYLQARSPLRSPHQRQRNPPLNCRRSRRDQRRLEIRAP
jgi:hypothetical protein